jgi:pimeloyl-ACP methyl ester carboxylesterase
MRSTGNSRVLWLVVIADVLTAAVAALTKLATGVVPKSWQPHLWLAWPVLAVLVLPPPRAWLERTANVVRITEPERGGHFAPFEEPESYVAELREFFRPYRSASAGQ